MRVMQRSRPAVRIAAVRAVAHRFSFGLLLFAAVSLLMVGKIDAVLLDGVRARVVDAVAAAGGLPGAAARGLRRAAGPGLGAGLLEPRRLGRGPLALS